VVEKINDYKNVKKLALSTKEQNQNSNLIPDKKRTSKIF